MAMKCVQCGNERNSFRDKSRKCKDCEAIYKRLVYLLRKETRTTKEEDTICDIHRLYEKQTALGLKPPKWPAFADRRSSTNAVSKALEQVDLLISAELNKWITKDLTGMDPAALDVVWDELCTRYKRVVGYDENHLPVYSTEYAGQLNKISERFDKYEEEFYGLE